jgi:hypothetical protein
MANQTDYQYTRGDQVDGFLHTFKAEGAITEGQILELGSAGRQVKTHTTTTTIAIIGVAHHSAASGEEIVVLCPGPVKKLISGAAGITRGQYAVPSGVTAGCIAGKTFADGGTLYGAVGIALETADALGERVPVLMLGHGMIANS